MSNRILFNSDGIVEFIIEGDQTKDSFSKLKPNADAINDMLNKTGKQRLSLVDISKVGKFMNPSLSWAAMEMLQSTPYEKLAIFGTNDAMKKIIKTIVAVAGKNSTTKIFSDRQSAVDWLLSR